jgi:uncharacterized protein (DUF2252 family)
LCDVLRAWPARNLHRRAHLHDRAAFNDHQSVSEHERVQRVMSDQHRRAAERRESPAQVGSTCGLMPASSAASGSSSSSS